MYSKRKIDELTGKPYFQIWRTKGDARLFEPLVRVSYDPDGSLFTFNGGIGVSKTTALDIIDAILRAIDLVEEEAARKFASKRPKRKAKA